MKEIALTLDEHHDPLQTLPIPPLIPKKAENQATMSHSYADVRRLSTPRAFGLDSVAGECGHHFCAYGKLVESQ